MPFLSVIIPVYNGENYLDRCLNSILAQKDIDSEVIIVDDGSTDNSKNIADKYASDKIKVFHKDNGGRASARNEGLKHASGRYVWFIDADDAIESDAFEVVYDNLILSESDILRFDYRAIKDGERHSAFTPYPGGVFTANDLVVYRHHAINDCCKLLCTAWMHVYKRELIIDTPFATDSELFAEDVIFNSIIYQKAKSIQQIHSILYQYSIRQGSLSHSNKPLLKSLLNSLYYTKKAFKKMGIYDEFKYDLITSYIDFAMLGGGRKNSGAVVMEFIFNKDRDNAHQCVQEAISTNEFKDILKDNSGRQMTPVMTDLFDILGKQDENRLYHYLGQLSLSLEKKEKEEKEKKEAEKKNQE